MPCCKPQELSSTLERWPDAKGPYRSVHWGDMEVSYTVLENPLDCTQWIGEAGPGVCHSPHYGYLVEGRVRCTYPGTDYPDEVATTGDVYYFPAGHVLIYEGDRTVAIDFSPADSLQRVMDMAQRRGTADKAG